ncbi:MAG: penicillin-binding protein [Firmicutes bacterium]|jgi:peptidoglycan glycosyltransferase|nr:penicillin-binding protein [Bacillota bacterium]
MKKLEGRALMCIALAAVLIIGLCVFVGRLIVNGSDWASFYANAHVYSGGKLAVGAVYDRNGTVLLENDENGPHYNPDSGIRKGTVHVVGDKYQNISTAVNYAFRSKIIGYNIVTGTKGILFGSGREIKLTIDADISKVAYEALGYKNGLVGVYNWKTGEVICMTSKPTLDPEEDEASGDKESGTYINKVLASADTPGSIFKLVTTKAAIENISSIDDWSFSCTGSHVIDGEKITCPSVHGRVDIYSALSKSCNCAYASLAVELGSDLMEKTVKDLGLTSSYDLNGIKSREGSFTFDTYNYNLGWAGIGQFEDQVNPMSMMVYMGAIAGGGEAAEPYIIMGSDTKNTELLKSDTAAKLKEMMRNNVMSNYGDGNYPGLELHAKSGTAEGAKGTVPDAWFCGFSGDYAFIVCVENGGYGSSVAGPIANKVLQALKAK